MRLKSQAQLRRVEWAMSHLWDIQIQDTHGPKLKGIFADSFFPAKSVTLNEISPNITNHNMNDWVFPLFSGKTGVKDLNITVYDDADNNLYNWYKAWIDYCSGGSVLGVSKYLSDSYKTITLIPKKRTNQELDHKIFKIIPSGSLSWSRDDSPEAITLQMSFIIVG